MATFRVIFVIDILNGKVVHAVKGERDTYRQVHLTSRIVRTSNPVRLLNVIKPDETYIADLNAIMRTSEPSSNTPIISEIRDRTRTKVILDMGVSCIEELEVASGVSDSVVIGTETASFEIIESASGMGAFLSLDIKNDEVLTDDPGLKIPPIKLLEAMNSFDLEGVIILNLSNVGTKQGFDLDFLKACVQISDHPIFLGGGVRGVDDLGLLENIGVSGALVATAIHDGSIPLSLISHRAHLENQPRYPPHTRG
ncbi:MAG: HisA/HisF-related TIM barrel protein [Candidatus Syntrophoarchaeum sp.]|nr:HisA/HisF-related TIM barrel protein [Candidatus Syntrophoarchaeum sp.]